MGHEIVVKLTNIFAGFVGQTGHPTLFLLRL